MEREILLLGDPRLYEVSAEVEREELEALRPVFQDMFDCIRGIRRDYGFGRAIAAPQIGVLKRIVIIDVSLEKDDPEAPQDFRVFINPVVTVIDPKLSEENEGCLSVPELRSKVKRPRRVALEGLDLDGNTVRIEGEGYFSACMQHETDHLDGKLFIDHISYLKRSMYDKKMKKAR